MQEVVGKILFDYVALVAAADNKIMDAMARVGLHDVPQNWFATNFNHGLGSSRRFLTDASAEAACENNCFHIILSSLVCRYYGLLNVVKCSSVTTEATQKHTLLQLL